MKTSEVLRKALEKFGRNGEKWSRCPSTNQHCSLTAIAAVATIGTIESIQAADVLRKVTRAKEIAPWNDSPRRTWPQVKKAFQQAIATAERGE